LLEINIAVGLWAGCGGDDAPIFPTAKNALPPPANSWTTFSEPEKYDGSFKFELNLFAGDQALTCEQASIQSISVTTSATSGLQLPFISSSTETFDCDQRSGSQYIRNIPSADYLFEIEAKAWDKAGQQVGETMHLTRRMPTTGKLTVPLTFYFTTHDVSFYVDFDELGSTPNCGEQYGLGVTHQVVELRRNNQTECLANSIEIHSSPNETAAFSTCTKESCLGDSVTQTLVDLLPGHYTLSVFGYREIADQAVVCYWGTHVFDVDDSSSTQHLGDIVASHSSALDPEGVCNNY